MHKKLFILLNVLLICSLALAGCKQDNAASTVVPATSAPAPTLEPTAVPPTPTPAPPVAVPVGALPAGLPQGSNGFPWWNDSTFYEIFVRSFYDSNGDGKGDFNGITQKLDYLNDGDPATTTDLGVTGLWLMPIFPSPSYHGYDTTDYFAVNPDYGTLDDFKKLLAEAHKRGIRIVIDMMLNHTSSQHPWFKEAVNPQSPYHDWYIWSEADPGGLGPWGQDVWYPGPNGGFYYAVFWDQMPDLNYNNPEVVAKMDEVVNFWLKDVQVDGLRLDGARYIVEQDKKLADSPANHEFFKHLRQVAKAANPQSLLLGEVWTTYLAVAKYLQGDELDLAFNFDLASAFIKSVNGRVGTNAKGQLVIDLKSYPPGTFAPFLTNHDQDRVMSQLGEDEGKARIAAAMLLTAPGTPFIYYGEEIGMTGKKPDEMIRTPMQWTGEEHAGFSTGTLWEPVNGDFREKNVAVQEGDGNSLLSFYKTLVQLRNNHVALRAGDAFKIDSPGKSVYAILRHTADETVLVIVNLGADPVSDYTLKLTAGPLAGTYRAAPLLGEGEFPELSANAAGGFDSYLPLPALPANSATLLQLQPVK